MGVDQRAVSENVAIANAWPVGVPATLYSIAVGAARRLYAVGTESSWLGERQPTPHITRSGGDRA